MYRIQTILFPTDFTERSREAFAVARSMARTHGARLVAVHVIEPHMPIGELGFGLPVTGMFRDEVRGELEAFCPGEPGLTVETVLTEGLIDEEVLRLAEQIHAELIVMATHGRTAIGRLFLGSVAEQVLHKARCPVLMVRGSVAKAEAEARSEPAEAASR